jgi:tetratricopeptide (TPR) repeat protein
MPDKAVPELETAIRLNDSDAFAHTALATCLRELGRLDEAEAEQRASLRITVNQRGPTDQQLEAFDRLRLAEILEETGRRAEAREELERAVALQREALSRGAASRQLLGQIERALRRVS